jgi:hypothetical protein
MLKKRSYSHKFDLQSETVVIYIHQHLQDRKEQHHLHQQHQSKRNGSIVKIVISRLIENGISSNVICISTKHDPDYVKPYVCSVCEKAFTRKKRYETPRLNCSQKKDKSKSHYVC